MFAIRFTNNILSTAQQVWLRKLGGAKPVVNQGGSGIITAGRAKRTSAQPAQPGERFKQLKEEESKRKGNKALAAGDSDLSASTSEDEESDDEITEEVLNLFLPSFVLLEHCVVDSSS
jgi:YidC/Oxa1 family membrane protein insertase